MMRSVAISATAFLAAALAFAQTNSAPAQPQAPGAAQQTQSGTAPGQPPATQPAPSSGAHRVLQAKSQEELKAYQDAAAKTDPAQAEAAADDFAAKYPNSELKAALYIRVMSMFAQSNNNEKVIAVGRQAIAADPTNPVPLVQVASALAESTRDSDLDREQRLAEAAKDAQTAVDNINTGLLIPPNADPAKVEAAKHSILTMAYDSLGMVNMSRNDYGAAVTSLQKAIAESRGNPEAVLYLRLSVAQDKLQQYPQALDSANQAVQYAQPGSAALNLAKQQQDRLQKLISAGPSGSPAPIAAPSSSPTAPANPAAAPTTQAAPH